MKIEYRLADSTHTSVAYLDDDPTEDGCWHGQDKYTDAPVTVRWEPDEGCWREGNPSLGQDPR